MILINELKYVIEDQNSYIDKRKFIKRNIALDKKTDRVVVISGVRRSGKSTILKQHFSDSAACICLNFEDPRLENFELSDFQKLEEIAKKNNKDTFIFDEIQNVKDWEKFVRSAHDKSYKIFITGSNASMLSKELGTRLTGRYKQIELFPFNYFEFLKFTDLEASTKSFNEFLVGGGFPEYLREQNFEYLRTLLKDIVIRDIAVRRNIRNEHLLVRLSVFLMSNVGKEFSYNNITRILNIKSVRTTIDYCDYLQESYLLEFIPRFAFSIKQQQANPKKVYSIDTGMANANSLSVQDDFGRLLENYVYLQLRHYSKDIQYFRDDKTECDFLIKNNNVFSHAIQVCWKLDSNNLQRELNGLKNAMDTAKIENGLIITLDQEDRFGDIDVVPIWKWKFQ